MVTEREGDSAVVAGALTAVIIASSVRGKIGSFDDLVIEGDRCDLLLSARSVCAHTHGWNCCSGRGRGSHFLHVLLRWAQPGARRACRIKGDGGVRPQRTVINSCRKGCLIQLLLDEGHVARTPRVARVIVHVSW